MANGLAALAIRWQEEALRQGQPLQPEQLLDVVQRLADALSVVSSGVQDDMPWSTRVARAGELWVEAEQDGQWMARWAGEDAPMFSLTALLEHALGIGAGYCGIEQHGLLPLVLKALKDGSVVLPGFAAPFSQPGRPGWILRWSADGL